MSSLGGPNIITNGLILSLDAANTKSYQSGSLAWKDPISTLTGSISSNTLFNTESAGSLYFTSSGAFTFLSSSAFNTITTNNSLTLSIFFKRDFTGLFRDVVGMNKTSGNNPFVIRINSSDNIFYDSSVGGTRYNVYFTNTLPNKAWVHACTTFGNNLITVYYNGVAVTTTSTSGTIDAFTSNQFGTLSQGYGAFPGDVSTMQLYNRALSSTEVLQNYNATKGRFNL
jgi:hypothetical protein